MVLIFKESRRRGKDKVFQKKHNSRKLKCLYTKIWYVCRNLPFDISLYVILDPLLMMKCKKKLSGVSQNNCNRMCFMHTMKERNDPLK